jgi:SWI/SNF-related matrix-associated actin-dependent regulator 1 of chromatin subfamily A
MKPLTSLFKHQARAVSQIDLWNGRALIADDPGLGKSLSSLAWVIKRKTQLPLVVICPASLKYNWNREVRIHTGLSTMILEGTKTFKLKKVDVIIINYDILHHWVDLLRERNNQTIIIDECHYIKNLKTKRYKSVKKLCKGVPHVLCLSGTPLTNRPAELFATLNLLRPDLYKSWFVFITEYCRARKTRWGWDYTGARNLDKLHQELSENMMIRRRKEDVLDLPSKLRAVVTLPLESFSEYKKAIGDYQRWASKQSNMSALEMQKQNYILRLTAAQKIPAICEWIDNFLEDSDQKLLVFGRHRLILQTLHDYYANCSVLVNGSVVGEERDRRFQKFNTHSKTRLLFGNIQAAGTGWSCNSCSTVAFVELPWTPGDLVQAEDRCHGINRGIAGQTTTVYYLLGEGTIEEKLCSSLQSKQKILSQTLDGGEQDTDINIHSLLRQLLTQHGEGFVK